MNYKEKVDKDFEHFQTCLDRDSHKLNKDKVDLTERALIRKEKGDKWFYFEYVEARDGACSGTLHFSQ